MSIGFLISVQRRCRRETNSSKKHPAREPRQRAFCDVKKAPAALWWTRFFLPLFLRMCTECGPDNATLGRNHNLSCPNGREVAFLAEISHRKCLKCNDFMYRLSVFAPQIFNSRARTWIKVNKVFLGITKCQWDFIFAFRGDAGEKRTHLKNIPPENPASERSATSKKA